MQKKIKSVNNLPVFFLLSFLSIFHIVFCSRVRLETISRVWTIFCKYKTLDHRCVSLKTKTNKITKTLFLMKLSFLRTCFILGMVSTKYGCHGRPQPGPPAQGLTGSVQQCVHSSCGICDEQHLSCLQTKHSTGTAACLLSFVLGLEQH